MSGLTPWLKKGDESLHGSDPIPGCVVSFRASSAIMAVVPSDDPVDVRKLTAFPIPEHFDVTLLRLRRRLALLPANAWPMHLQEVSE